MQGNIINSYFVQPEAPEEARTQVFITEKNNFGNYFVKYPELAPAQADALGVLKENLEYYFPSVEAFTSTEQMITQYLWKTAEEAGILDIVQSASEKLLISVALGSSVIVYSAFNGLAASSNPQARACRSTRDSSSRGRMRRRSRSNSQIWGPNQSRL